MPTAIRASESIAAKVGRLMQISASSHPASGSRSVVDIGPARPAVRKPAVRAPRASVRPDGSRTVRARRRPVDVRVPDRRPRRRLAVDRPETTTRSPALPLSGTKTLRMPANIDDGLLGDHRDVVVFAHADLGRGERAHRQAEVRVGHLELDFVRPGARIDFRQHPGHARRDAAWCRRPIPMSASLPATMPSILRSGTRTRRRSGFASTSR